MAEPRKRIVLTLEALPSDIPEDIRLRQLLKTALRRDRFKCVKLAEEDTTPEAAHGHPRRD